LTQNTTCPHEYLRRGLTKPNDVSEEYQGTFREHSGQIQGTFNGKADTFVVVCYMFVGMVLYPLEHVTLYFARTAILSYCASLGCRKISLVFQLYFHKRFASRAVSNDVFEGKLFLGLFVG
jgi:hypothetical protein